ncbi:hypothetical protein LTR97_003165 [Elasticomyces elasticus]|uniref:Uncharacterized protein n=1 Tax=Elasticomyces elasticus TaxID=574655 RepID=A0AAN7WE20_9PEZI|nr:hypothetical protein LTR97_003165 [Elasticomyces elasticus]
MHQTLVNILACGLLAFANTANAQTASTSGYVGYNLTLEGDDDSTIYSTDDTRPDAGSQYPDPDVYLNAAVHINLDAQVLNLLTFNAGVDLSIDRVRLLIENVNAKVLLEARLENLVAMIDDVLNSIDLNPIIAELSQDVGSLVDSAGQLVSGVTGAAGSLLDKRSFELANNIVYSVNNYAGDTHTNRILAQNGDLVDQYLDNDGNPHGQKVVGSYKNDMSYTGHERTTERDGEEVLEREYSYTPYHGITAISAIFTNAAGEVVGAQVLAESSGGEMSSVGDL